MTPIARRNSSFMLAIASLLLCKVLHASGASEYPNYLNVTDELKELNRSWTSVDDLLFAMNLDFEKIQNETYDVPYLLASNKWSSPNESLNATDPNVIKVEPVVKNCIPVEQCAGRCGDATVDYFNICQCDDLCWFYGDCCFDYYAGCLNVTVFDSDETILRALLANVSSYTQLLGLHKSYAWRRLSSCVHLQGRTFQAVNSCGTDPDIKARFEELHENLNQRPLDRVNIFQGISQTDIIDRCQRQDSGHQGQSGSTLDRIPASLNTSYSTVYFYNVFCALCNGISPGDITLMEYIVDCPPTEYRNNSGFKFLAALKEGCNSSLLFPSDTRKCSDIQQPYKNSVFDLPSQAHTFDTVFIKKLFRYAKNPAKVNGRHRVTRPRWAQKRKDRDPARAQGSNFTESGADAVRCNSLVPTNSRLCHMYTYPQVIKEHDLVFKNPHCQLCMAPRAAQLVGGRILDAYMCTQKNCLCQQVLGKYRSRNNNIFGALITADLFFIPEVSIQVQEDIPSFRVLYDFKTKDTSITVNEKQVTIEVKSCPNDQVYVPYYQKCSVITCPRGTHLVGRKCLRADKCLASGPCHKNDTGNTQVGDVLFAINSNTVTVKLWLWYTLDDGGVHTEKAALKIGKKDDTQSQGNPRYKDTNAKFSNISVSHRVLVDDTAHNLQGVQKPTYNTSRNSSNSQKKIRDKGNVPRKMLYVEREVILENIITVEKMRSQWAPYKLEASEYNKTHLLTTLMSQCEHTLTSQVIQSANHTAEISQVGVCSQDSVNSTRLGDSCIFFKFNFSSDLSHDDLVSLLSSSPVASRLVNAAHDNNFVLRDITLSNALTDAQLDVPPTIESGYSGTHNDTQRYCREGSVLYSELKPVVYNETSRSYHVEIANSVYPLGSFLYTVKIDIDARTHAPHLAQANVSWCRDDFVIFECNSTTVALNASHFVRYGTSIVVTSHMGQIHEFLTQFSDRKRSAVNVREFVSLFRHQHGVNDTVVYESGEYRVEGDKVFVCSEFNSSFEVTNESTVSRLYIRMSTDMLEQLTTLVALCVSVTCLVIVISVYSLVPELRNIPGRIVMSMSSALLLAQVLFLCCTHPKGVACEIYASVHHAAWLASSSWLVAMSVHLTFILHSNSHGSFQSGANSFTVISSLCWGLPLLLAGCCFTLDKTGVVHIDYGKNGLCWIGNVHALLFAFGVPLFILLAVTSVCAVFVIRAIRNSSDFRTKNTATHKGARTHVLLCINLALLMGFNWVFYFVAVAVEASSMWAVFILTNGSQGLYIFLCYVARKSVLSKLFKRLNLCQGSSENCGRTVGSLPATRVTTLTTTLTKDLAMSGVTARQGTPSASPKMSPILSYHAFKM